MPSRTLFLAGLPPDATERELHLLFVLSGGCEAISIRRSRNPGRPQPVAFVQFSSAEQAEHMLGQIQGLPYDPAQPELKLRVEIAANDVSEVTHSTRPGSKRAISDVDGADEGTMTVQDDSAGMTIPHIIRSRPPVMPGMGGGPPVCRDFLNGNCARPGCRYAHSAPEAGLQPPLQPQPPYGGVPPAPYYGGAPFAGMQMHTGQAPGSHRMLQVPSVPPPPGMGPGLPVPSMGGAPRSSTVFIGGLAAAVTSDYVEQLCRQLAGYERATLKGQGSPLAVAFVKFSSPETATKAVETLMSNLERIEHMREPGSGKGLVIQMAKRD
eukprot:TRINITY_DN6560_c4_g1_i1.p1 TRINITY_DN6560_c4_g1~~TRINITY_DN6560_c4_g1_i1.p1  ORF type:complete len:352 (+),score=67.76 TRINITY_DN6560_c4_g1_i1:86-1057(+)